MTFIHPSRRYRLYFDETGTGDLKAHKKDPNQRYLSLTGLVLRQDIHDTTFSTRLAALKRRIFGTPEIILHRREIMDGNGAFSVLADNALRAAFDAEILSLIGHLPGPVFTVSIDKQAHFEKYAAWHFDPYHYVLTCLVERFLWWLRRTDNLGDVMGEARSQFHDKRLRRAFRYIYENGTDYFNPRFVQSKLISRELQLEPKTTDVAGLQVADLLAHPAHRNFKFMQQNIPIPDDYGSSVVKEIEKIYDRHPTTRLIRGCGRKWLP